MADNGGLGSKQYLRLLWLLSCILNTAGASVRFVHICRLAPGIYPHAIAWNVGEIWTHSGDSPRPSVPVRNSISLMPAQLTFLAFGAGRERGSALYHSGKSCSLYYVNLHQARASGRWRGRRTCPPEQKSDRLSFWVTILFVRYYCFVHS